MNVLIAGNLFSYPLFTGSGATTRVHAYARGLTANGARVKVLCVEATESRDDPVNTEVRGTFEGVDFEYTYGATSRPASFARRRLRNLGKWWRFFVAVGSWAPDGSGVDAMILYTRRMEWIAAARVACWATGATLIHEDVERPYAWRRDDVRMRVQRWTYEHVAFKAFDGCLAISGYLRDYCLAHVRRGAQVIVVPILVDVEEFRPAEDEPVISETRIAYCGSLSHPQSVSVVEAFAAVAEEFPDLTVQLIGAARRPEAEEELRELARRLGVEGRVEFAGRVPRQQLIRLLRSARVLVLPRPKGAQAEAAAEAALPTKVGEYLAAGRPVVASAAGDLARYLTDGVDAFLTPSGDTGAFAERLRYVLKHPAEALEVGARGRETARREFDPITQGARILDFIERVRRQRRASRPWAALRRVREP